MKTRYSLSVLCALSLLMISAGSGSAQMTLHPDAVDVTLQSSSLSYDLNQGGSATYTVQGSIVSFMFTGSFRVQVPAPPLKQWIITTTIGGNIVQNGDMVSISANQTLPVVVSLRPYAEVPDTETYCLGLADGTTGLSIQCITLTVTGGKAAVGPDQTTPNITIVPNPAGNYIFMSGLSDMQAGYRYEIYSVTGAEVLRGMLPADARISTQELPSGAYRLLLFDGNRSVVNTAFTVVH
ncbi:MAG: T9SS type A sorting domain-containing protein [Bacteroidota bacterium]|nr:T9SS type A sorting domain-containing protein [Bacteroidota bacterium]